MQNKSFPLGLKLDYEELLSELNAVNTGGVSERERSCHQMRNDSISNDSPSQAASPTQLLQQHHHQQQQQQVSSTQQAFFSWKSVPATPKTKDHPSVTIGENEYSTMYTNKLGKVAKKDKPKQDPNEIVVHKYYW